MVTLTNQLVITTKGSWFEIQNSLVCANNYTVKTKGILEGTEKVLCKENGLNLLENLLGGILKLTSAKPFERFSREPLEL